MDYIKEYYENNNFPNPKRLYEIMRKAGHYVSLGNIKKFYEDLETEQVTKIKQKKKDGHITAYYPNEFWNIDIFDLSKYKSYNKNYRYIFCVIDIFSRKVKKVNLLKS